MDMLRGQQPRAIMSDDASSALTADMHKRSEFRAESGACEHVAKVSGGGLRRRIGISQVKPSCGQCGEGNARYAHAHTRRSSPGEVRVPPSRLTNGCRSLFRLKAGAGKGHS